MAAKRGPYTTRKLGTACVSGIHIFERFSWVDASSLLESALIPWMKDNNSKVFALFFPYLSINRAMQDSTT
jgi:hypothetical protein